MTTQMKRCVLFLTGNVAINALFIARVATRVTASLVPDPLSNPDDRIWWARVILAYVAAQIIFRVLAMITLAAHNAATGETEAVDREDELDKLIDLKSTALTSGVFMVFFLAALATQAFALPLYALFATLSAGMIVSGLAGDAANLVSYRRGY